MGHGVCGWCYLPGFVLLLGAGRFVGWGFAPGRIVPVLSVVPVQYVSTGESAGFIREFREISLGLCSEPYVPRAARLKGVNGLFN